MVMALRRATDSDLKPADKAQNGSDKQKGATQPWNKPAVEFDPEKKSARGLGLS
jgi:hypothetical protein